MAGKDCEEEEFFAVEDTFGGEVRLPSCNPAVERVPDEFREPRGEVEQAVEYKTPGPVLLGNLLQRVTCSSVYEDDVYGKGTVVPSYSYTGYAYIKATYGISDAELDYIASILSVEEEVGRMFHECFSSGVSREEVSARLSALLSITVDAATALYDDMVSVQEGLDLAAYSQAVSMLDCYWFNKELVQNCSDIGEYDEATLATPADHKDAVITYRVPAGLIKSSVSQDDADAQAQAMARDKLNCFYVSDPVTVDCTDEDRPGKPYNGGDEPVPVEKDSVIEGREPRNGTVSLPKGLYISRTSKEDATNTALKYAYSLLVCYYFNAYTRRKCGLPDARAMGVDPLEEPKEKADLELMTKGQEAVVPMGYIVSEISTADANAQAERIAVGLLECCYISPEIIRTCDYIYVTDEHGNPVVDDQGRQVRVSASDKEDYYVPETIVPRGQFYSCVDGDLTSKEDNERAKDYAREQAEQAAGDALYCAYCNSIVLPTCVPEWVLQAVDGGIPLPGGGLYTIDLPLNVNGIINPFTGQKEDVSKWSTDATQGMAPNMFCSRDYYTAQKVAEEAGMELAKLQVEDEDDTCTFENCIVHAACHAQNPYTTMDCIGSSVVQGTYRHSYIERGVRSDACGGGEYIWMSARKWKSACAVSSESSPPPCEYITIDPGTFKVTIDQTPGTKRKGEEGYSYDENARLAREYANSLAMDMALSSMCCKNPPTTVIGYCDASGWKETETAHGVYDDMPTTHSYVMGTGRLDEDCCGCTKSVKVLQTTGLESLMEEVSTVRENPVVMEYVPEGCFNERPHFKVTTSAGGEVATYDECHEAETDEELEIKGKSGLQGVIDSVKSMVQCWYGNKEVCGWCSAWSEDVGSGTKEEAEVVSNEFCLPENTIISDLWYNAQILAEMLADTMIQCMYGNIEVKAKCKCKKSEYKDQLEKWEYLRMIVPFKCGKMKKSTIFASNPYLAKRMAQELAEMLTVCRIKPCEDRTPFHVSYECDPEDPCDLIEDPKLREKCEKDEKKREKDYSDCILRMNHGMVYLSNGRVVQCPERRFAKGTTGKLSVAIKGSAGNYRCVHLVNGVEV